MQQDNTITPDSSERIDYMDISIDLSKDSLFDDLGLKRLRESYMMDHETSPQQRYAHVSKSFSSNPEHAQRLYEYASNHWLSYATPELSYGRNKRGLPISCFLTYLPDSAKGLIETLTEVNTLSMLGGGVGIHMDIRSADDKSTGIIPHLKTYDASCLAYKQGSTRRGSYAAYLDISHPEIVPFIEMRKATGDPNIRCPNLNHGVNITDDFMEIIEKCMIDPEYDDSWNLIDPASKEVVETVSAKELWQLLVETRVQRGEPYMHFIDTANRALPAFQKALGLKIHGSNLCQEIELSTDEERTAVCCLASLNLNYYDDWKDDYQFHKDVAEMLDNVLETFINTAPPEIYKAKYSAIRERAIGVGVMGFHAYLQQNNIPFECALAKSTNMRIFKSIRTHLDKANQELAIERGECPDAIGYGKRFSHTMAVAPNASSSILMGNTSPGIEPFRANAYRQDTLSGFSIYKNRWLNELLLTKNLTDDELNDVWKSIIADDGSVQKLTILTDDEKMIFKTALEIDQRWVIELATDRAQYIDQGQSVNVFFRPDAHIKYLHAVHFTAWKKGLKGLYYLRSDKVRKADKVSQQIQRNIIEEIDMHHVADGDECLACQ
jgi:ribonucleoside-diphosphate reductase alpha chain